MTSADPLWTLLDGDALVGEAEDPPLWHEAQPGELRAGDRIRTWDFSSGAYRDENEAFLLTHDARRQFHTNAPWPTGEIYVGAGRPSGEGSEELPVRHPVLRESLRP